MMVRKPEPGDRAVADRIRGESETYTTPVGDLAALSEETERMVAEFREKQAEIRKRGTSTPQGKKRRGKRRRAGRGSAQAGRASAGHGGGTA